MRNTTLIVLLFSVLYSPFTNLHAQTQITSCNTQFTDVGGDVSNYLDNENSEWLICPDEESQILSITFTRVDIEAANNKGLDSTGCYDILRIYDGLNSSAPLIGSYCGEESGSGKSSFIEGHTLNVGDSFKPQNTDGCFFLSFTSDQSKNLSGWEAEVTCCVPTLNNGLTDGIEAPLTNNNGNYFDLVIDNSCTRNGSLELFTEFEPTGESCYTKGLSFENQAFYAFKSNPTGGFVEFQIDSLDSVGIIEMVVFGPVTLDSTRNYSGGFINDCAIGKDPWSVFFNAGPNQTYILGIATEIPGKTTFTTLPSTIGLGGVLPVKMIDYNIRAIEQNVELSWTTTSEINNDRFEIYRSLNGSNFENIGRIKGSDSASTEHSYSFLDKPNSSGDIYYYIRQIDLDGGFQDYAILQTTLSKSNLEFTSFPNPSNGGNFSLRLDKEILESQAQILIYDQMGIQVVNQKMNGVSSFDFENLTSGIYTIKIIAGSTVMTNQHIIY